MPVYEFACQECDHHFDITIPMDSLDLVKIAYCEVCRHPVKVRRVYTTFALRIKKGPTERLGEDMKI